MSPSRALTILCIAFFLTAVGASAHDAAPKRSVSKAQEKLFEAAKSGHAKDVQRAIAAGGKVEGKDDTGVTAITYAVALLSG